MWQVKMAKGYKGHQIRSMKKLSFFYNGKTIPNSSMIEMISNAISDNFNYKWNQDTLEWFSDSYYSNEYAMGISTKELNKCQYDYTISISDDKINITQDTINNGEVEETKTIELNLNKLIEVEV